MNRTTRIGGLAALALVVALVAGCTGEDDPNTSPSSGTSATQGGDDPTAMTREELQDAVFEGDLGTSTVLGSVEGAVPDPAKTLPARIDVTSVTADEVSTVVRFTLANLEDTDPLVQLSAFNEFRPLAGDIRDVAIVDTTASQRLRPYVGYQGEVGQDAGICTCSDAPLQMSRVGQFLSATFPPLDPSTTEISVEIPGFPAVENVAVTRR